MTLEIRRASPPYDYKNCARQPCTRPAQVPYGGRNYCLRCANEARAFMSKHEREGVDAVRGFAL